MENLIILNEKMEIEINPIILSLAPFAKLWKKHKDKNLALKEISFVWYMCSHSKKNPYYIEFIGVPLEAKIKAIANDLFEVDTYTVSKEIMACMALFEARNYSDIDDTIDSLRLTKKALKDYFKNFNPENDSSGDLKNNIDNITKIDKVIKELEKDKLNEENSEGRITGGSEEGNFETFSIIE